jgi:hypothetical protein
VDTFSHKAAKRDLAEARKRGADEVQQAVEPRLVAEVRRDSGRPRHWVLSRHA